MKKIAHFLTAVILTIGSLYMVGELFPLPDSNVVFVVLLFLLALVVLFLRVKSRAIAFGILGGLGLVFTIAVYVLIQVAGMH